MVAMSQEQMDRTLRLQIQSLTILKEDLAVVSLDIAPGLLDASIRRVDDNLKVLRNLLRVTSGRA